MGFKVASLLGLLVALHAGAQLTTGQDGDCLYMQGSKVCPQFISYFGVEQLADTYPFFADVTDVASFDEKAEEYFTGSDSDGWIEQKFVRNLSCPNAANESIQWQRTVMCSTWAFSSASQSCQSFLQGSSSTNSIPRVCGTTCSEFSQSATNLTENTQFCSARGSRRSQTLASDLSNCYQVSGPDSNCVTGEMNEPGTCGFGPSTEEACAFCQSNPSASCCSSLTACSTSSGSSSGSASPTSSGGNGTVSDGNSRAGSSSKGLSGGAIAGIVIGVIVGLALLGLLVFLLMRRRRQSANGESHLLSTPSEKLNDRSASPLSVPDAEDHFASSGARETRGAGVGSGAGSAGAGAAAGAAAGLAGVGAAGAAAHSMSSGTARASAQAPAASAPAAAPATAAPVAAAAGPVGPGSTATVKYPYSASLDDELNLEPGMKILVHETFDDGWATGTAQSGGPVAQLGKLGKFPMVCVGSS